MTPAAKCTPVWAGRLARSRAWALLLCAGMGANLSAQEATPARDGFGESVFAAPSLPANGPPTLRQCVQAAAGRHGVNSDILAAILEVESGSRPVQWTVNANNTADIGVAGINSIHLPTLAKMGIQASQLLDPCTNTFVAAWLLRQKIQKFGNNWFGIAAYHSITPVHNHRYQILLHNVLVRRGVVKGPSLVVPTREIS